MKEYKRKTPLFSLCGLNCGLCPRYRSEGASKCPGCGGEDFHLLHPSCSVISCAKKHGDVEYCFLCFEYPCERYRSTSETDSFITYQNVLQDMKKAAEGGIEPYMEELNEKVSFLSYLIADCNDGKHKSFYCIAVNLLNQEELRGIKKKVEEEIQGKAFSQKEKALMIEGIFYETAKSRGIDLKLRK